MIADGELTGRGGDGERMRVIAAEVPLAPEQRLGLVSVLMDFVTRQQT